MSTIRSIPLLLAASLLASAAASTARANDLGAHPEQDPADDSAGVPPEGYHVHAPVYETVIVPRLAEAPGERRVDADTLATTPAASGDDLLRLVPGLLISRHGAEGKGRQIFLRGFDAVHGADLEVTVDGVPWNEASNVHGQGYLDLGTLIPEAVLALDADKGASRLEQGPFATAGSVRFSLGLAPDRRGARLGYEIGSSNRHRLLATLAPKTGDSFLALEALRDGGYGQNRDTDRVAALAGATVLDRGAHRIRLFGGAHASRFGEPGTVPLSYYQGGRVGFHDSLSPDTRARSARAFAAARWTMNVDPPWTSALLYVQARHLRLQENFTGFLLDGTAGDRLQQQHQALRAGLRLFHERPVTDRLYLVAGVDGSAEWIDQHEDHLDAARAPMARNRDLDGRLATGGAQAGLRWMPLPWLRLEGGARMESVPLRRPRPGAGTRNGDGGAALGRRGAGPVAPGAAVCLPARRRDVDAGLWPRGAPARGPGRRPGSSRQHGRSDLSRYRGGPPRATVADGIDLGGRLRLGEHLDAGLGGFVIRIDREQLFDHISGTNLELRETRRLGVEGDVTVRPLPWLALRADLTAVDARFTGSGSPVPGAPRLFGSAGGACPPRARGGRRARGCSPSAPGRWPTGPPPAPPPWPMLMLRLSPGVLGGVADGRERAGRPLARGRVQLCLLVRPGRDLAAPSPASTTPLDPRARCAPAWRPTSSVPTAMIRRRP